MATDSVLAQLESTADYGQGLQRRGLGYLLASDPGDDPRWEVGVSHLRASGGELRGELRVLVNGRHVSAGTFNVSSLTARASTARLLAARSPGVPWADVLERICVSVLATEGAGEPAEVIGRRRETTGEIRLLSPLLPSGHPSVLFGPGGAGKTTVAAAIATSVSTGSEVIPGWCPSVSHPVVVLDWESTAGDWSNLLASIAEGARIEPPKIAYLACTRPLADDIERVAELVAGLNAGLVVVDSVGLALGIGREAGDPADAVLRLHQALRHLKVTSLLVDHVTGADIGQGVTGASKPYGSVYKINTARDVWELRREQEPQDGVAEILLVNTKTNLAAKHSPIGLRVVYRDCAIRFETEEVTAPELEGRMNTAHRMRRLLSSGATTTKALSTELGIPESSIRSSLQRHPEDFTRLADGRIGLKA